MKEIAYLIILLVSFDLSAGSSEQEKIYKSILKATFTSKKNQLAKQLLNTDECKEGKWTLKLIKDSHYWNREAGVFLADECKNPKLDEVICDLFVEDHMTRNEVKKTFQKDPSRYSKILMGKYNKEIWVATKRDLFSIYEISNTADTSDFLQKIVQDQSSPDRALAFKTLIKHSKRPENSFFRSYLEDKELRKFSLEFILDTSDAVDLELFRGILADSKSEGADLALACMAIQKWGNANEKKSTYLRFLKEDEQSLLPSAFSIFNGLLDDEIFLEVSRLSRAGKTQVIRTEATLQLKNSKDINRIPFIILFIQEDYQTQRKHHVGDTIATVITLGIHGIFQGLKENKRRNKFYSIRSELIQYLQKETGEKIAESKEWKVWANKEKLLPISVIYK